MHLVHYQIRCRLQHAVTAHTIALFYPGAHIAVQKLVDAHLVLHLVLEWLAPLQNVRYLRTHRPLTPWVLIRIDVSQLLHYLHGCSGGFLDVVWLRDPHTYLVLYKSDVLRGSFFQNLFHLVCCVRREFVVAQRLRRYIFHKLKRRRRLLYDKWTGILGPCRIDGFEFRVRLPRVALHDGGHGPYYIQVVLLGLHGRAKGHQRAKEHQRAKGHQRADANPSRVLAPQQASTNRTDLLLHTLTIRVVVGGNSKTMSIATTTKQHPAAACACHRADDGTKMFVAGDVTCEVSEQERPGFFYDSYKKQYLRVTISNNRGPLILEDLVRTGVLRLAYGPPDKWPYARTWLSSYVEPKVFMRINHLLMKKENFHETGPPDCTKLSLVECANVAIEYSIPHSSTKKLYWRKVMSDADLRRFKPIRSFKLFKPN